MATVLTAEELNKIAAGSGYTGGSFSSVGLPTTSGTTTTATPTSAYLTPEQYAGVQTAQQTVAPTTLSSASLTPTPTPTYQTPTQTNPYPVSGLNAELPKPEMTLTAPEIQAQDLIKQLMGENTAIAGESAYRSSQEVAQGIPELQKTQTDLSARLKTIQNEANAIPLQLQQNSEGRGITAGGLRPIEMGALRTNAIQALTTSSLLEASRGNLTTALAMVDRAVEQKFGPMKAERDAKIANLQLLINSPEYSLADKKRAQAQLDYQEAQQKQEATQEENAKAVWSIATTAASNGSNFTPTSQYSSLALALDAISKAASKENALSIASSVGLIADVAKTSSGPASVQEYEYAKQSGFTGTYQQWVDRVSQYKPSEVPSGVVAITPEDKRLFTGAGLSESDITNIQKDIAQFGIDAVLNNITDPAQKSAIQKVYGAQTKVTREQVTATVTQKIAQDELKKIYTQEELEKLAKDAGFAGFFTSRAKEVENYLASDKARQAYIDYLYKQYQAAGMAI